MKDIKTIKTKDAFLTKNETKDKKISYTINDKSNSKFKVYNLQVRI
jgi:hypothetical protein